MIRKGSRGEDVKRLQTLLGITADGIFGSGTEAAVIAFQREHGLTPDGIVGSLTWTALESASKVEPKSDVLIIIGTAHGSNTPGKRSPDGRLREYKWSREVCDMVESALKEKGYNVVVDLKQDYEPSLAFRVSIVNNLCKKAKNALYVSIHVNAASNGDWKSANFWTVWTSRGNTKGDKLAARLWKAAHDIVPSSMPVKADYSDGDVDYEANFYVLKNTACPAALTENFFQDNKANVEWLLSDEGKQTICDLHVKGIEDYIKYDL